MLDVFKDLVMDERNDTAVILGLGEAGCLALKNYPRSNLEHALVDHVKYISDILCLEAAPDVVESCRTCDWLFAMVDLDEENAAELACIYGREHQGTMMAICVTYERHRGTEKAKKLVDAYDTVVYIPEERNQEELYHPVEMLVNYVTYGIIGIDGEDVRMVSTPEMVLRRLNFRVDEDAEDIAERLTAELDVKTTGEACVIAVAQCSPDIGLDILNINMEAIRSFYTDDCNLVFQGAFEGTDPERYEVFMVIGEAEKSDPIYEIEKAVGTMEDDGTNPF